MDLAARLIYPPMAPDSPLAPPALTGTYKATLGTRTRGKLVSTSG